MAKFLRLPGACLWVAWCAAGAPALAGQASFRPVTYMSQYSQPRGLIEGSPGVLYFVSGSKPQEAALSVTLQGSKVTLAAFYGFMQSTLVAGADGRFYSSQQPKNTVANVFSVTAAPGSRKVYAAQSMVASFAQGLPDGTLLGTGVALANSQYSLIKCDLDGNVTPIHQFPSSVKLVGPVIYASDGNYYGVMSPISNPAGTISVYRVSAAGDAATIWKSQDRALVGSYKIPLIQASDGNLYGVTPNGGINGTGTIYKLTLDGQFTLLYTFPKDHNSYPTALIEASDGNLYGATYANPGFGGYSQIFRITKSGQYTLMYAMKNMTANGGCQCDLVQASDGVIYGTAQVGGTFGGGMIFALDAGLQRPRPWAQHFWPQSGRAGARVRIWGHYLLSAQVQFNGIPAADVSNGGSDYVWATVPAGATTGPISVTTPGGIATTAASFVVR